MSFVSVRELTMLNRLTCEVYTSRVEQDCYSCVKDRKFISKCNVSWWDNKNTLRFLPDDMERVTKDLVKNNEVFPTVRALSNGDQHEPKRRNTHMKK